MEIGPLGCWGVIRWEILHRCCELDTCDYCQKSYMDFTWGLKPYVHLCKVRVIDTGFNWMRTSNLCSIGDTQPSNWCSSFLSSSCIWSRVNHRAIVNRSPLVTYSKFPLVRTNNIFFSLGLCYGCHVLFGTSYGRTASHWEYIRSYNYKYEQETLTLSTQWILSSLAE